MHNSLQEDRHKACLALIRRVTYETLKEGERMKLAIFSTLIVLAIIGFAAAEALTSLNI